MGVQNPNTANSAPLDEGGLSEGVQFMHSYFERFKPRANRILVTQIRKTGKYEIKPNMPMERDFKRSQLVTFHFPPYRCAWRRLDGTITIRYRVRNYSGTGVYAPKLATSPSNTAAYFKPYLLANMWKRVSIAINGTEIKSNYEYSLVHFVTKLMTITKKDLDYERALTGFYIPTIKYLKAATGSAFEGGTGQELIQHPLVPVPTKHTFTAAPEWDVNTFIANFSEGTIPTIDDNRILTGKLPHPLFGNQKLWPPECPLAIQMEPNHINKIFYCIEGYAPTLVIDEIVFTDTVVHVTEGMVDNSVKETIKSGGGFHMPYTSYETNYYNLKNGVAQDFQAIIQGAWPSKIIVGFIPTASRTETKSATTKFISKYPPLTNITVYNGEQEYPRKGGITFRNVPDFPNTASMSEYLLEADLNNLIMANRDTVEWLRGEMLNDLTNMSDLAWTPEMLFTCQFWVPISFTPIDRDAEAPDVVFPKESGDMRIKLEFKHEIDANNWTMVVISIRDSLIEMTPPTWSIAGNF